MIATLPERALARKGVTPSLSRCEGSACASINWTKTSRDACEMAPDRGYVYGANSGKAMWVRSGGWQNEAAVEQTCGWTSP